MFICNLTGDYINSIYVCDKKYDCSNGEDENDCEIKEKDYFYCLNNEQKILYKFICDDVNDCFDASDEKNCCI